MDIKVKFGINITKGCEVRNSDESDLNILIDQVRVSNRNDYAILRWSVAIQSNGY